MSLFDSASLVVTPNGYKEDKLYSIKPTDGSGDLVVTRATTATRVNSDGLIEVTPYNLATYSEQFNNATFWALTNSGSITPNTTIAPNGTLTADTLVAGANASQVQGAIGGTIGTTYTVSIWIKRLTGTGNVFLRAVENADTLISVTSEWQRFTATITSTSTTIRIGVKLATSGDTIAIWGAQLVTGTSAKEYFPTTDRLDVPRLDYTNSSCPSILVEPQRTNLLSYSEQFDNAYWVSGITVTPNFTTSPDGTNNADRIILPANIQIYNFTTRANSNYNFSLFVKKVNNRYFSIQLESGGAAFTAIFDLDTSTVTNTNANTSALISNVGNGWYRVTVLNVTSAIILFTTIQAASSATSTVGGSGTYYIWGAQLEAGSYPTSYIPTVASSVTRNADVISKTGISSLIGQTEGTLFVDVNYKAESIVKIYLNLGTSTSNYIAIGTKANNKIGMEVLNSGVQVNAESTSTYSTNQRLKIAMTYKLNDFKLYVNGILQATDTSGTVPAKAEIYLGSYGNGTQQAMDGINSAQLYKTALSDTECINLTTI